MLSLLPYRKQNHVSKLTSIKALVREPGRLKILIKIEERVVNWETSAYLELKPLGEANMLFPIYTKLCLTFLTLFLFKLACAF